MAHSIAILERVRARLAALPKPDQQSKQLNKQESIGFLAKDLIASMSDGHTLDELAAVLAEEGVSMSPVALKSHLRRARRRRPGKRTGGRRPVLGTAAAAAEGAAPAQSEGDPGTAKRAPDTYPPGVANGNPKERSRASLSLPPRPGSAFVARKDTDKV